MPSDIGPASKCGHGGPEPSRTGEFLPAMMGVIGSYLDMTNRMILENRQAQGADAELDLFFRYWSRPEMAATISRHSYKVCFSCAVDATIDANFAMARCFLRAGFFVRMWARCGGASMMSTFTSKNITLTSPDVQQYRSCMNETKTDQGVVLFLAREIPCSCLDALAAQREKEPKTRKCCAYGCEVQKPKREMMLCSGCHVASYCSRECQNENWNDHKQFCKIRSRKA